MKIKLNREWHRWFAWRPVFVEGSWVWLSHVYRRACCGLDGDFFYGYQYSNVDMRGV